MIRITQEKAFFYILWKSYKENPEKYVPAWKFVGEIYIEELNKYFLMSYKCPANGVNVFFKNGGGTNEALIERQQVRGKSGSRYYEYRIAPNPSGAKIHDPTLLEFYQEIKRQRAILDSRKALLNHASHTTKNA